MKTPKRVPVIAFVLLPVSLLLAMALAGCASQPPVIPDNLTAGDLRTSDGTIGDFTADKRRRNRLKLSKCHNHQKNDSYK